MEEDGGYAGAGGSTESREGQMANVGLDTPPCVLEEMIIYQREDRQPDAYPLDEPPTPEEIENAGNKTIKRYQEYWLSHLPINIGDKIPLTDSSDSTYEISLTRKSDEARSIQGITIKQKIFLERFGVKVPYYKFFYLFKDQDTNNFIFGFWDQTERTSETNSKEAVNGFLKLTNKLLSPQEDKSNLKPKNKPTEEPYAKSL
jgi:hypothetical protein